MSELRGKELTQELFHRLDGKNADSLSGKAIVIVTVDEQGWSHPAMLSYHEVVAKDRGTIDLASWKNSTTARNLRRDGKITLLLTDRGLNFYVKGKARELRESMEKVPSMSLFRVEVQQLLEDQEAGAMITSGVTYQRSGTGGMSDLVEKVFQGVLKEPAD